MASSSSPASVAGVIPNAPPVPYPFDSYRDRLEYELTVRQEPKQARMCGVGGKADRRPIDPPPIVQLVVVDPLQKSNSNRRGSPATMPPGSPTPSVATIDRDGNSATPTPNDASATAASYAQSYLQNPYYFMFASLAKPDDDAELHWLKDNRTRCTTGSVVSSLYHLKDPQSNRDAGFFVFPDLSVRTEGSYRLKLSLYEVVGPNVRHCKSIFSAPFYVYTAKKFPGMEESTPLSCSLADQGIKIRIRKDIRVRKRPVPAFSADASHPVTGTNTTDTNTHQSTFDAQSPFGGPPSAMPMQPPATYQSTSGYYPSSQQPQYNHTYASFPVPPPVQQYHPLAPPPGSIPASGPLQPLPPEAQPGWGQQTTGGPTRDMRSRSRSRSRTPASADEREGERGRGRTRHGSVTDDGDEEDRMDVEGDNPDPRSEGQRDEIETIGGEDSDNDEYRPTSSSSKATSKAFTQSARRSTLPGTRATTSTRRSGLSASDNIGIKVPGSDRETRSKKGGSKNSPKLKSVKSASSSRRESRENKRARTENYQYQQHQSIAPAPWAPAPHPSLTPSSSSASLPPGVPAPINDPSLNGESIGGLPPGVRIPPPPGATIAPGAPGIAHNSGLSMTGNVNGSDRNATATPTPMTIRIPPPPGASIDSAPPSAGSAAVPGSANANMNNSNTSPTNPSHASTTDIGNSDGSVQNLASTSGYQHPPTPYEQHSQPPQPPLPPPSSYSVTSHSYPVPSHAPNQQGYGVPSASLAPPPHSSQYPSHPPQHQQPGPLPPPPPHYGGYHQMPPHPQYAYGHPPQMMPPPPSTPQGYTAYPAPAAPPGGNSWGVGVQPPNPNTQMLDQYPHQQQMQMQMHIGQMQMQQPQYQQQPQYGYQQVRYEYSQAQHQIQPQSQHHLQPPQMYAPYAPIPAPPYGYYDPSSGQQPPQQNPSQATSSGQPYAVNTPPPNAIGVAPVPLSGPGHPPSQSQLQQAQSTTPSNVNVNNNGGGGYVDYGSGYAPPRAGSPRGVYYREQQQQQQQQQQYGYPNHPGHPLVHPPPPHAPVQPQSHPAHAMQLQHPQHHPYPPPYGVGVGGYMAYGNNGNGSTTPGTFAPSSNNGEIWGANASGSSAPGSWDASSSSSTAATNAGTASNTVTGGYHSTPPQQQQVGALGSPGDRIQLAPLRVQQNVQPIDDSSPSMYPSVIQLRSSSHSRGAPGSGSGTTEVTNISSSGRERERERGRDRDREKEAEGIPHRDRDREGVRLDRSRDERGKKNPLAIGSIIESG